MGDYVLVEAQLAIRPNDAVKLRERRLLVGHGAEHQRSDPGIKRSCLAGKSITHSIDYGYRDRRARGCLLRTFAQIPLGLHSDYLVAGCWVMREVRPGAGAYLNDPAAQA